MRNIPFRSASTISPVISTLSSFCAMVPPLSFCRWCAGRRALRPAAPARSLRDQGNVRGLRALVALLGLVLHLRALGERPVAAPLDGAEVDEQILATLIRGDEPVTLVSVEPLDSSGCHIDFPLLAEVLNGQERADRRHPLLAQNCRPIVASFPTRVEGRRTRWLRTAGRPPRVSAGGRPRGSRGRAESGRACAAHTRSRPRCRRAHRRRGARAPRRGA